MRRISIACIAAIAAVGVSNIASAADLPAKAPIYKAPVAVAPDWTGFYVGGNIGGGWGNRSVDYSPNDPASVSLFSAAVQGGPPSASFTSSGVLGGLQLGYNHQFNRSWLIGIETDFDWSGIKGSGTTAGISGVIGPFSNTVDEHIKWFGTVRARLGYLPTPNLLAYATGGFAYGKVERTGSYDMGPGGGVASIGGFSAVCVPNATCFLGSSSRVAAGWTVGGGLEYAAWQKWTLKAEYLYVSLDAKSITESAVTFLGGTAPSSFDATYSRANFNVARVGVNYRF